MSTLAAFWYVYIYNTLYSTNAVYDSLTSYSEAITSALSSSGYLYAAYLIVRTIAQGLVSMYFIISLGTKLSGREMSTAGFFRCLIEYFVGYTLTLCSFDLVNYFFQLGDALGALVPGTMTANDMEEFKNILQGSIDDFGFIKSVSYCLRALLPALFCIAANFLISYTLITRVLRICLSAALSPIAVANYFGGKRSDAMRFVKKTLAMCLQCAVIMVIVMATVDLTTYMATNDAYSESNGNAVNEIENAKKEMMDNTIINSEKIRKKVEKAINKLPVSETTWTAEEISQGKRPFSQRKYTYKGEYENAFKGLTENNDKVTSDDETKYKEYESKIGIKIFKRENKHYVYDDDGYAILENKYKKCSDPEYVQNFLDALTNYKNMLIILVVLFMKVGIIKQSLSLCNMIVGV